MNDETKTLGEIRSGGAIAVQKDREIAMAQEFLSPFSSMVAFTAAQKMGELLAGSRLVPRRFQGADRIGDCVIALNMANRMNADPVMVMQNLYVVHETPAWSGQFVIAAINQSGLFAEPLRFEEVGTKGQDDWGFYAEATSRGTGNVVKGPTITIGLAKAEGWYEKNVKWKNIPEMMLRYRAGSWFGRTECPEILMGFATREEIRDVVTIDAATGEVLSNPFNEEDDKPTPVGKVVDMAADLKVPSVTAKVETGKAEPEKKPVVKKEKPEKPEKPEKEAQPEMTNAEADRMTQLQDQGYYEDSGRYFNANGDLWDPNKHATAKESGGPIVNADGSFRARRGGPVEKEPENDPIPDNPDHEGQQQQPDDDLGDWE
jgi:hypothetical protein